MQKQLLTKCLLFCVFLIQTLYAQNLMFTEIMYNDPRPGTDKLEFLEIYNHDVVPVNLLGYSLGGVTFTFPDTVIQPNQYYVVAVDKDTFSTMFGFQPFQWTSGSLLNTGETVKLFNASGGLVDSVKYSSANGWNTRANGFGPSLILCDVNVDNNLATSWDTSTTFVTIYYGKGLKASPGVGESCITDTLSPTATYAKATSYTQIKVGFSEAVSNATATALANYNIALGVSSISQPNPDTVLLNLTNPLVLGQSMFLTINNVADLSGNAMVAPQVFQVGLGGIGGNLIITEIMYNDAGAGTDYLEFIELYNADAVPHNLMGYSLVGVNYVFPNTILQPNQFITVAVNADSFMTVFGFSPLQWTSGSLANAGETVKLLDALNHTVDSVTYSPSTPWTPLANGLGHSLMLCNVATDNAQASAWNPSSNYVGVYKGIDLYASPNNIEACPVGDTTPPHFTEAIFVNPTKLILLYNELVDASATNPSNYNILPALNITNMVAGVSSDSVICTLGSPASLCVDYNITAANIADISGNIMPTPETQLVSFCPDAGKVVITEIMYNNPGTDNLEFIEIYNADVKAINMKDFAFNAGVTYTFPDTTMYPGEYWLLAGKPDSIQQYLGVSALQFTGSLLNTGELIQLVNSQGIVIDSVRYKATAPWSNQANGQGPSLAFCNATLDNGTATNWSVSNVFAGVYTDTIYATPAAPCNNNTLSYIPLNDTIICGTSGVLNAGNAGSNYLWSTGETTQTINITNAGSYWVAVNNGIHYFTDTATVTFAPTFALDVSVPDTACLNQPEAFEDASAGTTAWFWSFGDNTNANTQVATHTYSAVGTYTVTLLVSNGTCNQLFTKDVYVKNCNIGIDNQWDATNEVNVSPNPFNETLAISLHNSTPETFAVEVMDITGKLLYQGKLQKELIIDTQSFAKGMYFVKLQKDNQMKVLKVMK